MRVTDTEGNVTTSVYDMGDRRTEVSHPASGVTSFTYDALGNVLTKQTAGGLRGEPMAPAYSATKAYQINYMEALRKKAFKAGGKVIVTDIRPGLVNTAMAKGEGLFWVMPVEKVASQICAAIRKRKSKVYVTKRWHVLAIINKNLPFTLYKRM